MAKPNYQVRIRASFGGKPPQIRDVWCPTITHVRVFAENWIHSARISPHLGRLYNTVDIFQLRDGRRSLNPTESWTVSDATG